MVASVDTRLSALEASVPLPGGFVVPGGTAVAAAVDLARTLVRRAERRAVGLRRAGALENPEVLRYLNRVGDLLFMMAREAEQGAMTTRTAEQGAITTRTAE
jgi:cob(I)alamin adenosyltransferase